MFISNSYKFLNERKHYMCTPLLRKKPFFKEMIKEFRIFLQYVDILSFTTTEDDVKTYKDLIELTHAQDKFPIQCIRLNIA